ncbi:hypothetical protein TRFO_32981 [Tritrichomonas foetus]|uniref:Uncharacterized protein n=1 Tax=Tritrichomonas foetus TaxID=1144522 RepID=A0A1J4JMT8_9EUKA|nr:hypothetical protein TRFO_32981 [Tritrichomonas foetus]|eukprot:OHT00387.1 hypothetical protein TRFO_32981 [Tritrichomonas foetus]
MSLPVVAFTRDIEKPQIKINYSNKRNSHQKSKNLTSSSIKFHEEKDDLRRYRDSSDDDMYRKHIPHEAKITVTEPINNGPNSDSNNITGQIRNQNTDQVIPQNSNSHFRPTPPSSLPQRQIIHGSPRFRPRPPGAPKAMITQDDNFIQNPQENPAPVQVEQNLEPEPEASISIQNIQNIPNQQDNISVSSNDTNAGGNDVDRRGNMGMTSPTREKTQKVTYTLEKETLSKYPKKKRLFNFKVDNKVIISVVVEGKPKSITFQSKDRQFCILVGNKTTSYSLRIRNSYGDEIIGIQINKFKKPVHYRNFVLHTFSKYDNYQNRLESQSPIDKAAGFNFGTNNYVFFESVNEKPLNERKILITMTQNSKSHVSLTAVQGWAPEMFFTVALAALINKTK